MLHVSRRSGLRRADSWNQPAEDLLYELVRLPVLGSAFLSDAGERLAGGVPQQQDNAGGAGAEEEDRGAVPLLPDLDLVLCGVRRYLGKKQAMRKQPNQPEWADFEFGVRSLIDRVFYHLVVPGNIHSKGVCDN